jgi:hypothetical protein
MVVIRKRYHDAIIYQQPAMHFLAKLLHTGARAPHHRKHFPGPGKAACVTPYLHFIRTNMILLEIIEQNSLRFRCASVCQTTHTR